ncbi:MAG TPA: two-component regulator propeller domain-containing protein, partial [Candidatus Dormibacteraeota bacterium]|nr:two-component regulator propeller domain-containing protein [Candidatus Dormibacteraeota bacterium]
WDNGSFTTFSAEAGFPNANAQALASDRDGSLWVGTERGLVQWRDGKFRSVGPADGMPAKQVRALLLDSRGTLWVSVLLDGLYCRTNGTFIKVQSVRGVPADAYCLAEDNETNIWAGAGTGRIWRCHEGVWTQVHATNGVPKANIESLAQAGGSPLWIAARDRGIGFLDRDGFHDVTAAVGFSGESSRVVLVDREGMIWVGTYSDGLRRISRRLVRAWGSAQGLGQRSTMSVTEGPDGRWWVCTPSKGIFQFQNGQFRKLEDPKVLGNNPFIYTSAITEDGSVWAAGEQCLFRFQAGRETEAFYKSPIGGEAIRALCPDGTNLWMGTYFSTLLKVEGTNVATIATNGSFGGGINSIVREAPGVLWIGTSEGLYRWDHGVVKSWGTRDGLATAYIRALHRDADGTVWFGTLGGGLGRLKNGVIASLTTRHGLVDDVISQIAADDIGHLWLGSNRGIMGLERRELDDF